VATTTGSGRKRADGTADGTAAPRASIELAVEGMTCASCATRVQKKLNKVGGVSA
jgi:P-type Cu+ transporter